MLKIKDNVDLKELEKYGFEKHMLIYCLEVYKEPTNKEESPYRTIYVEENNRRISISPTRQSGFNRFNVDCELSVIYDLIKDGLVEKVEE